MRLLFVSMFAVGAFVGCRGGHVSETSQAPRDLGSYESAVVRAVAGRDVALTPGELGEIQDELVARLEEGRMFAHVSRGEAPAQLSVTVSVDELEDTTNPLDIDERAHANARAKVQLIDLGANRIVGEFDVEATDRDKKLVIVAEKGSARAIALRNVARATAKKLRASR